MYGHRRIGAAICLDVAMTTLMAPRSLLPVCVKIDTAAASGIVGGTASGEKDSRALRVHRCDNTYDVQNWSMVVTVLNQVHSLLR